MRALYFCAFFCFFLYAEQGFYSSRNYRIPSSVEQSANSIIKIVIYDESRKIPLGHGTGFVAGDHSTVWTAAHVLGDTVQRGQSLSVKFFDNVGRELFSSVGSGTSTAIVKVLAEEIHTNGMMFEKDFAQISINSKLPQRPLVINNSPLNSGSEVYVAGFPAVENVPSASEGSLRDGLMQSRISYGKVIDASRVDRSLSSIADISKLIVIDGDGYFGQSGSPILNDSGEVIGIFTAMKQQVEGGPGVQIRRTGIGPSFWGIFSGLGL